jgi:Zn-finger nucleic acid-binding protein
MKCPICADTDLVMTERQGVEIDYCPKCRGVWLDRGELDKIIERSQPPAGEPQAAPPPASRQPVYDAYYDHHSGHQGHGYYKRKSWLREIFD